tara:strand:- start:94 stop:624 length:531 start_codon:yes stop_codon:yes gene_type:complete
MKYVDQYKELHKNAYGYGDGWAISRQAQHISNLVNDTNSKTLLDFGSGKADYENNNIHLLWGGILPARYDPAIPQWSEMPEGTFDGVFSADVMEHIPEDEVHDVLTTHFEKANKFVFLGICTKLAKTILPNGENAHCTVEDSNWWSDRILKANKKGVYTHLSCYGNSNDYRIFFQR